MNPRRKWTAEEDWLIRSQPDSTLSVWKLERMLRAKTETIEFRAQELGVELRRCAAKRPPTKRSIRIPKNDPLLQRLRQFHEAVT